MSAPRDVYDEGSYRKQGVPKGKQTNCLLVRNPVGHVKPTTYALPPDNFAYGRVDRPDDEGARACLSSWKTTKVETATASKTSAKVQTTHVAAKPINASVTYGRPSKPSTPITNVICNEYQRQWISTTRDLSNSSYHKTAAASADGASSTLKGAARASGARPPQATKASLGHCKPRDPEPEPEMFKMARFKDVPARVRVGGKQSPSATAAQSVAPISENAVLEI